MDAPRQPAPTDRLALAEPAPRDAASRRRRPAPWRAAILRVAPSVALPLVVLVGWQIAGQRHLIANGLFPPPTTALAALLDWIVGPGASHGWAAPSVYDGTWLANVASSVGRILAGYLIGGALAVAFGLFAGVSLLVRRLIDPTINALRPISVTAWIPLTLIFFGIGSKPAIFLTALATFFPVYVNALAGAQFAEGKLVRAALMLGANRRQILLRVTLPAALPSVAVGMRVAAAIAWTTVVVAEILGAKSGLGFVLMDSYNQFRFDYIVAAMISLGACGYLTDRIVQLVFSRWLRWVEKGAES